MERKTDPRTFLCLDFLVIQAKGFLFTSASLSWIADVCNLKPIKTKIGRKRETYNQRNKVGNQMLAVDRRPKGWKRLVVFWPRNRNHLPFN